MTDSKTATERLREMLDGRGEEWEGDEMPCAHPRTVWGEPNGFLHEAIEFGGLLNITSEALDQTPEQAIAATVGSGASDEASARKFLKQFIAEWCDTACGAKMTNAERNAARERLLDEHARKLATLGWIEEPDTIRNELADGGLIADDYKQAAEYWQRMYEDSFRERTCEAIHDTGYYIGINGICEGLYCSKCGEPLSSKFGYCPWCGAKVIS